MRLARAARAAVSAPVREWLRDRHLEVLRALADGLAHGQAAERRAVSHGTVRKDAIAVYAVLGVRTRGETVSVGRRLDRC